VVFDEDISHAQNVILSQGAYALRGVLDLVGQLRAHVKVSPLTNMYPAPEIPGILSNLCFQAGLASTILFSDAPKGRRESEYAYRLRRERITYVDVWCASQGLKAPVLRDRDLRNSLTHIDEHLADAMESQPMTGWFVDAAIASRHEFQAPNGLAVAFCRCYVREEDKLLHLKHEMSISDLTEECRAVLAVVFGIDTPRA
jgi:hypothetical protein